MPEPIAPERLAEIRALNVDSCSADARYNADVWDLEHARMELLAEVDRLNAFIGRAHGRAGELQDLAAAYRKLGNVQADARAAFAANELHSLFPASAPAREAVPGG